MIGAVEIVHASDMSSDELMSLARDGAERLGGVLDDEPPVIVERFDYENDRTGDPRRIRSRFTVRKPILVETVDDGFGGSLEVTWLCDPPPMGVRYTVVEQSWNDDYTSRVIRSVELVGA